MTNREASSQVTGASQLRMGELMAAFAFASDLAFGLEMEDCLRSCYVAVRLAERLGMSAEERQATYYTALLKDAGCTCWNSVMARFLDTDEITARRDSLVFSDMSNPAQFLGWMRRNVALDRNPITRATTMIKVMAQAKGVWQEGWETACEISARIATRLQMPEMVCTALLSMFEFWDGKGLPHGAAGEAIPPVARLILPAFLLVPFHRVGGREAALEVARRQRGKAFDPRVCDAFESLAAEPQFWHDLEEAPILDLVLSLEPASPFGDVDVDRFDAVAMAFADFIDLKSPYTAAHSRRVATMASSIATLMGLSPEETTFVRRVGLMHDLGLVAVPTFYIEKHEASLSAAEREAMRLHPYHGERIVSRVGAMSQFASAIGTHHERFDGTGYIHGLKGKDIPLASRIVAVADQLDHLTHEQPDQPAASIQEAIAAVIADSGSAFDPDVVFAVAGSLGKAMSREVGEQQWPAGLSHREVEVLRLASKGLNRQQIGRALGISPNTVRHHLSHIYEKTGTTTRVAATLFAMEHDLLP